MQKAYSPNETTLYDRLRQLFAAMDKGDPILNVPTYNGGLFNTMPDKSDRRDQRISRFLLDHCTASDPMQPNTGSMTCSSSSSRRAPRTSSCWGAVPALR
ncbi:MAG: hypothetical protein ACHRXM_40330 [Isosphaerales bacterium]